MSKKDREEMNLEQMDHVNGGMFKGSLGEIVSKVTDFVDDLHVDTKEAKNVMDDPTKAKKGMML